jgi:Ig-like domain from next to BRCA1 gene
MRILSNKVRTVIGKKFNASLVFVLLSSIGYTSTAFGQECKIPHFTATTNIKGVVTQINTTADAECKSRAKKLAFYGKWDGHLQASANEFRASQWITNGETQAIEMADFVAKNNALLASVDAITASAKGVDKILADGTTAAVMAGEASKLLAKVADLSKSQFLLAGNTNKAEIADMISAVLKLLPSASSCMSGNKSSCLPALKASLKTHTTFNKHFGNQQFDKDAERKLESFLSLIVDIANVAKGPIEAKAGPGAAMFAFADVIDLTSKASTGEYWRDKAAHPKFWDEFIMAIATSSSAWARCKGAGESLIAEQKKFIGRSAECVKSVTETAVNNMANLMSRSTVLYKASQDVYQAKNYELARALLTERFQYDSFDDVYRKYGISLSAQDKEAQLIEKFAIANGYNYKLELGRVMQIWSWDRFGVEVGKVVTQYANNMINDANALQAGQLNPVDYAKNSLVRFINAGVPITLEKFDPNWDGSSSLAISAKSTGVAKAVLLQAVAANGSVRASSPMRSLTNNKDGTSDWVLNLSTEINFKDLPEANYQLRVILVDANNQNINSLNAPLNITKAVANSTGTIATPLNQSIAEGTTLTMQGSVTGPASLEVYANWTDTRTGQAAREKAVYTAAANRWIVARPMNVAGVYNYRMEVFANGTSTPFGEMGKVTVGMAIIPPGTPNIEKVQPQGEVKLNTLASMVFMGQNLNADVLVTLDNCINGKSNLTSSNQISHQCTPVAIGQQKATWRVKTGGEVKNAGTVNVVGNAVSPTDGMAFKDEETIPDGSIIAAAATFNKAWTLHNTGSSTWDSNYCLRPISGESLGTTPACVSGRVAPSGSYVFSVPMKAPIAKPTTTTYKQNWALSKAGANAFGTQIFVDIKVNGSAPQPPTPPVLPPIAVNAGVSPASIVVGQNMTFTGKLSSDVGVSKVELLFPKHPTVIEAMASSGNGQWSRTRTMQAADSGAPFQVKVTMSNGQNSVANGFYTVTAAAVQPPIQPPIQPPLQPPVLPLTVSAGVNPASVVVGQNLTFTGKVSSDAGVSKVELLFPKYPNMVEAMVSNGNGQWSRTRTMQAADSGAPFQVKVTMSNGQNSVANGFYTVTAAAVQPPIQPPVQPPVVPVTPTASVQSVSPSSGALGQKVRFSVTGSQLAPTVKLQLAGEQCSTSLAGDNSRREFECTNNSTNSTKQLTVTTLQGASLYTQSFTVTNTSTPPPVPSPDLPINPRLVAGSNITSGVAWNARLTTSVPIYSADIIFNSGKRIPLDGDATNWESRDVNSKFSEAAVYSYTLQIRRRINSQLETFPGGTLEVRPAPIAANTPRITSALTSEQGKPYSLTVQTSASADRVTVQWPDTAEQGLGAKDAQKTQWESGNRLFSQATPVNFTVKVYKDGVVQPTGQTTGSITITQPAASLRLLEIAKNILIGENPLFKVETSLSVVRVAVQLGNDAAVNLSTNVTYGATQIFSGPVPARNANPAMPYTITGFNAQGQAVGNKLTGNIEVKALGDSLKTANPIPAELNKGQSVNWQFLTVGTPGEMWLEFAAPINRQNLNGTYLNHVFNYPAGNYAYRLMRKDHLGNVFPIGGASGTLRIKDVQVTPPPAPAVPVAPLAPKPPAPAPVVPAPAPVVPTPAPKPALPAPAISNLRVEPGADKVGPLVKFDAAPAAARSTVKISGRTFEFACSAGTQVLCNYTGGLNVPKGVFTAEVEAFNANGQSSGVKTVGFTR